MQLSHVLKIFIIYYYTYYYFIAGYNSLPRSLTNTSDEYSTSIESSTQIDNSSVLETLLEDQETYTTHKSKIYF